MGVDDPLELRIAALGSHRRDHLGDHVACPVADHVGTRHLAAAGVDDELDKSVPVVLNGSDASGGELLLANLALVAGLPGLFKARTTDLDLPRVGGTEDSSSRATRAIQTRPGPASRSSARPRVDGSLQQLRSLPGAWA